MLRVRQGGLKSRESFDCQTTADGRAVDAAAECVSSAVKVSEILTRRERVRNLHFF